jgi:hypothetical protein
VKNEKKVAYFTAPHSLLYYAGFLSDTLRDKKDVGHFDRQSGQKKAKQRVLHRSCIGDKKSRTDIFPLVSSGNLFSRPIFADVVKFSVAKCRDTHSDYKRRIPLTVPIVQNTSTDLRFECF